MTATLTAPVQAQLDEARATALAKKDEFNKARNEILKDPELAKGLSDPKSASNIRLTEIDTERQLADEMVSQCQQELTKMIAMEGGRREEPAIDAVATAFSLGNARPGRSLDDVVASFATNDKITALGAKLKRDPNQGVGEGVQFGQAMSRSEFKNLISTGTTGAGAFTTPQYDGLVPTPLGRPRLQQLIDVVETDRDTISFTVVTQKLDKAGVFQPVSTVEPGAEDGMIPMGTAAWERISREVKPIGEGVPVDYFALSDAGELEGEIRSLLNDDFARAVEEEIYGGVGTGMHLLGIKNAPGVGLLQYSASYNLIEQIRRAITSIRIQGHEPEWIAINPLDGDKIRFLRDKSGGTDTTGGYLAGSPFTGQSVTLWGLPLVEIGGVEEGLPLVGSREGARLYVREAVSISVFDQHKDWAARFVLLMRAHARMALGVRRPQAFCNVEITNS